MKFTSWNIRGLGSKRKQRLLSNRMKQEASDVIFIQETKCSIQKVKEIDSKWLNRFEFLEVKAENTTGGILTLWNPQKIDMIDAKASRDYISVIIQPVGDKELYLATNVYGPQRPEGKLLFPDSLQKLRTTCKYPLDPRGWFQYDKNAIGEKRRNQNSNQRFLGFSILHR